MYNHFHENSFLTLNMPLISYRKALQYSQLFLNKYFWNMHKIIIKYSTVKYVHLGWHLHCIEARGKWLCELPFNSLLRNPPACPTAPSGHVQGKYINSCLPLDVTWRGHVINGCSSPGHSCVLHCLVCWLSPSQLLPPNLGLRQSRFLICWPPPHVTLQSRQSCHGSQEPSTVRGGRGDYRTATSFVSAPVTDETILWQVEFGNIATTARISSTRAMSYLLVRAKAVEVSQAVSRTYITAW